MYQPRTTRATTSPASGVRCAPSTSRPTRSSPTRGAVERLAAYRFPEARWSKLRSTNPLGRVDREIGRRADVVGISPNDDAAVRLAGALLIEQIDEWQDGRCYLPEESLAVVLDERSSEGEEVQQLPAA